MIDHQFPAVPGFDSGLLSKFVQRIDAGDWSTDRCWLWTGYRTAKGYGVFAPTKNGNHRAHRFALKAYLGREIGAMVLHKCDNPSCVNPFHLMEGSHGDNMRQMAERKRAVREERHHKAKATWHEAMAVLLLYAGGEYSTYELGELFGLSQPSVSSIVTGRTWPDCKILADAMLAERGKALVDLASAA